MQIIEPRPMLVGVSDGLLIGQFQRSRRRGGKNTLPRQSSESARMPGRVSGDRKQPFASVMQSTFVSAEPVILNFVNACARLSADIVPARRPSERRKPMADQPPK